QERLLTSACIAGFECRGCFLPRNDLRDSQSWITTNQIPNPEIIWIATSRRSYKAPPRKSLSDLLAGPISDPHPSPAVQEPRTLPPLLSRAKIRYPSINAGL